VDISEPTAQQLQSRRDEAGWVARRYMSLIASRKDLLYRATERAGLTERILTRALQQSGGTRRDGRPRMTSLRPQGRRGLWLTSVQPYRGARSWDAGVLHHVHGQGEDTRHR
jgi:hypothetical protein